MHSLTGVMCFAAIDLTCTHSDYASQLLQPLLVENIAVELILTLEQVVTGHPEDMKDVGGLARGVVHGTPPLTQVIDHFVIISVCSH